MAEFQAFPKIPRLNRDITITEKIDGTNAAVIIERLDTYEADADELPVDPFIVRRLEAGEYVGYAVSAQSRKRLIYPNSEENKGADNFGFAGWVQSNREELVDLLGAGRHFGEWWGTGIARGYGLESQRNFSLFRPRPNWSPVRLSPPAGYKNDAVLDIVPVMYEGPFRPQAVDSDDPDPVQEALWSLKWTGSEAAPGFMDPEGIMIYHTAAGLIFKVTCKDDDKPKEVAIREATKVAANGGGKVDLGV